MLPQFLSGDMQGAMQKLHTADKPKPAPKKIEEKKPEQKKSEPAPVTAAPAPEKKGLLGSLFGKKK